MKLWRNRKKVTPEQEEQVWNHIDSLYSKLEEGKATEEELKQLDGISRIIREISEKSGRNRKRKRKTVAPKAWNELLRRDRERLARTIGMGRMGRVERKSFSRGIKYAGIGMAASVLLAWGISFYLSVTTGEKGIRRTNALVYRTIQCRNDSVLHLTDGTVVHLAGGSHLGIANDFGKRDRKVALVGEAFFEVAKDKKRAFIVRTKEIDAIVHGTSFNVAAYDGTVESRIEVRTGCVEVAKGEESFGKLWRGDRLMYNKIVNIAIHDMVNPDNIGAWTNGGFVLEDATAEELKTRVKNRFHRELVIKKEALPAIALINYCSYKTEQSDIESVIKNICATYGVRYEIDESRIVVTK